MKQNKEVLVCNGCGEEIEYPEVTFTEAFSVVVNGDEVFLDEEYHFGTLECFLEYLRRCGGIN